MSAFNFNVKTFLDRKDAGEKLGLLLSDYWNRNPLVLGIPRGGVEVAYYVAQYLNAELSVIISKKLTYPQFEEYGFGALSEENSLYISNQGFTVSKQLTEKIIEERKKEIQKRIKEFRDGKPLPEMKGRVVILVDDGIETGVTLVPCIRLCRKHKAAKIIVAVPVASKTFNQQIYEADDVRVLVQPETFYGVGQVYEDFSRLTDEEVRSFLRTNKEKVKL